MGWDAFTDDARVLSVDLAVMASVCKVTCGRE